MYLSALRKSTARVYSFSVPQFANCRYVVVIMRYVGAASLWQNLKSSHLCLICICMRYVAVKRRRTGPTRQDESGPDKKVRAEVTETLLSLYIEWGLVYACMMIDELPNWKTENLQSYFLACVMWSQRRSALNTFDSGSPLCFGEFKSHTAPWNFIIFK